MLHSVPALLRRSSPAPLDRSTDDLGGPGGPRALARAGLRGVAQLARSERFATVGRLAGALTTPLLPADYLGLVAPLTLGADLKGRIIGRRAETADATTLLIRPGRGWRPHTPGQYVRLGVDVDGVRHWRAYSVTSRPAPDLLAVTVKRIAGGKVSGHLVDAARPGQLVMLDQATGDFVVPDGPPPSALFVTAGSGITPVMGILRSRPDLADVVLVHSAPRRVDVVFGPELRALAAAGRVRLIERHTDTDGLLHLAELDALVPDWRARQAWVCGPAGLLDAAESHWDTAGLGEVLHVERFRPVVAATGEGGHVSLARQGLELDAEGDRPLLDSAEDAGALMPSGCRMGICFGCALPLTSGAVRDLRTGELTTAEPGDGVVIQTCITAPAGPCELDA